MSLLLLMISVIYIFYLFVLIGLAKRLSIDLKELYFFIDFSLLFGFLFH